MDNRQQKTVLLCDNDTDHSFTLASNLRSRNFEVVTITDASELLRSAKSLRPVAVLVNPETKGFNEEETCNHLMSEMNIPVILLLDKNSTHRGHIGNCRADDEVTKPAEADILSNLIDKQMAWHGSNP